jgi:hypothetical protein
MGEIKFQADQKNASEKIKATTIGFIFGRKDLIFISIAKLSFFSYLP